MIRLPTLSALAFVMAGCAVGPGYQRPVVADSPVFKEQEGWKPATPGDEIDKGAWWSIYRDQVLDGLEVQVAISNQTLKQAEAAYREAAALVDGAEATLFPTVSATGSGTREKGTASGSGTSSFGSAGPRNQFSANAGLSWAPDLWGKIRRTIEQNQANAEASAGDVANARLTAQATLATAYFQLRAADSQKKLLDESVAAYTRNVQIVRNRYSAGTAAKSDLAQAITQLDSTRAQAINVGVARAESEHAIAVLVGKPPSALSLDPQELARSFPVVPTGLPSTLLERRPDIATAERQVAAANAGIGVAIAAYYPDLTLTGSYGVSGSRLATLFQGPQTAWSLGGSLAETIFDAGARDAQIDQARATWEASVANYRQTVLTAFQSVEDQLSTLRILEQQAVVQDRAVTEAREAEALILNQYKAGLADYTAVITAETAALTDALTALQVRSSRATASVALIQDLGGGWNRSDLPGPDWIADATSPTTTTEREPQ